MDSIEEKPSFLDWRAQTYPRWMVDTPAHIAMSKSLSTNLSHLYTLRALEELTNEDWGSAALASTIDEPFGTVHPTVALWRQIYSPIPSTSKIYWRLASPSWTWEPIRKPYSNIRTPSSEHLSSTRSNSAPPFTITEPTGTSYLRMPFLPPNSLTTEPSSMHSSMPSSKVLRSISRIWKTGKSKRVRTGTKMVNTPVPSSIPAGNSGLLPGLLALWSMVFLDSLLMMTPRHGFQIQPYQTHGSLTMPPSIFTVKNSRWDLLLYRQVKSLG